MYRIAAEAVQNVAKHARASRCTITLSLGEDQLVLQVADNGVGLPDGCIAGVGLDSMRERAAELGGTFAVESTLGRGTSVLAAIPCKANG